MQQHSESPSAQLTHKKTTRQRVKAALANLFIGDSLSMPVHWFYNPGDIIKAFGKQGITGLEAAPDVHPGSIMSLHSTTGGGRSRGLKSTSSEIVGEVILKGRRHLWGQPGTHYHHGMQAGDNTLNAWWARRLINYCVTHEQYRIEEWAQAYIDFMTADPPSYPDTYAESCHRGFFANWAANKPALTCGAVTHDTPSMGALVTVAPLALSLLGSGHPIDHVYAVCREHVWLTHPDKTLLKVVDSYVVLLNTLLSRDDSAPTNTAPFSTAAAVIPGTRLDKLMGAGVADNHVVGRTYSLACYITDSWPSVCFLAAKYHDDVQRALLTNTNLGGENAHRGSVLGTLVGLASGNYPHNWYTELTIHAELDRELEAYLDRYFPNE